MRKISSPRRVAGMPNIELAAGIVTFPARTFGNRTLSAISVTAALKS